LAQFTCASSEVGYSYKRKLDHFHLASLNDPATVAGFERLYDGLRKAGMPEQ
jgi:hypothetical protein